MHLGGCLCGAVRFEVAGDLTPPAACHCSQCRKQSGHYWAASEVKRSALAVQGEDRLTWFESSPGVRRGFCSACGSFLFWEAKGQDSLDVAMGAFDGATGARLEMHIYTADKGDYYDIADSLPQRPQ